MTDSLVCPACGSKSVITARKRGARWCRRCGHEWPLAAPAKKPPEPKLEPMR